MKNEWYKEWFSSEDYLKVYGHRDSTDARKLIDLIITNISLRKNARILDAACGAGRHSLILKENDFDVFSFDLSFNLLKVAKSNAHAGNKYLNLFQADIRKICLRKSFDAIFLLFTSFGYFKQDEENFIFPRKSYKIIKNKGFFVLDYLNEYFIRQNIVPENIKHDENRKIIEQRSIVDNFVIKKIFIEEEGIKKNFIERVKLYDKNFIIEFFENIGFTLYKAFGDYDGSKFIKEKSKRLILIFRK